jgi:hypothetical protein
MEKIPFAVGEHGIAQTDTFSRVARSMKFKEGTRLLAVVENGFLKGFEINKERFCLNCGTETPIHEFPNGVQSINL